MLNLFFLIATANTYITYDKGDGTSFTWTGGCNNGMTKTADFYFSGQFERIPQVAVIAKIFDMSYIVYNGYNYQIVTTLTKFTISVQCPYGSKIFEAPFYWFAFDDKRVQVINEFNYDLTSYTGTLDIEIPYSHTNPNFNKAVISLTNFHYKGELNFTLSVASITKTDVTVSLKSSNNNIVKVGYQLILAVDSALTIDPQIVTTDVVYSSAPAAFPTDKDIAISPQGFYWTQTSVNIRIKTTFFTDYYTFGCWDVSMTKELRFTPIYFSKVIQTTYNPMLGKVRVSQIESINTLTSPYFELKIVELTKSYNYNQPTIETIYIPANLLKLNLILQYNCPSQQELTLNLYTKTAKFSNRNFYCQRQGMVLSMYFTFKPATSAIQELQLTITQNSISISQKLQNVIVSNVQIMNLIIIN